jgi:hypothetical protein
MNDIMGKLGGWAAVAGVDLLDTLPKSVSDHPWIGQTVTFPYFVENGWFTDGKIIRCIVHPQGKLMFDVEWPIRCPPIHGSGYRGECGYEVVLKTPPLHRPTEKDEHGCLYHDKTSRHFADELLELVKDKPQRKQLTPA